MFQRMKSLMLSFVPPTTTKNCFIICWISTKILTCSFEHRLASLDFGMCLSVCELIFHFIHSSHKTDEWDSEPNKCFSSECDTKAWRSKARQCSTLRQSAFGLAHLKIVYFHPRKLDIYVHTIRVLYILLNIFFLPSHHHRRRHHQQQ